MLKIALKYQKLREEKENIKTLGEKKTEKTVIIHFSFSCSFYIYQGQNGTGRLMQHQKIEPEYQVKNERMQAMNGNRKMEQIHCSA